MYRIALAYVLLRYRTWIRAGWQLGRHEYHQDVFWAHRTPRNGTWHVECYWDGYDWRVGRLLDTGES